MVETQHARAQPGGPDAGTNAGTNAGTGAGTGVETGAAAHRPPALAVALGARVLDAIRPLSAGHRSYALLDFPYHRNIGDSAIWMGEVEILRRIHGRGPDCVTYLRYGLDEPDRFAPGAILYLHGGGNFGDIWPAHQTYREAVLARYPDRRIVQLPQSVHFGDPAAVERCKRAIGAHRDFHFMVRDAESRDFVAREFDCPVYLVPDCAFGIDMGQVARTPAPRGITCLLRSDKERRADAAGAAAHFPDARIEDWHGLEDLALRKQVMRGLKRIPGIPGKAALMRGRAAIFDRMARRNVMTGFAQLDAAEVVVTDRLHGHIMSALLGKPHVVIDNFYGKIANFRRVWEDGSLTRAAVDYAGAGALARDLLAEVRAAGQSGQK